MIAPRQVRNDVEVISNPCGASRPESGAPNLAETVPADPRSFWCLNRAHFLFPPMAGFCRRQGAPLCRRFRTLQVEAAREDSHFEQHPATAADPLICSK
jgi:hypothetical protein